MQIQIFSAILFEQRKLADTSLNTTFRDKFDAIACIVHLCDPTTGLETSNFVSFAKFLEFELELDRWDLGQRNHFKPRPLYSDSLSNELAFLEKSPILGIPYDGVIR